MDTITVETRPCVFCNTVGTFTFTEEQLRRWHRGAYLQDVRPDLTAEQREQLISGTCPSCWDQFMGDDS